MTCPTCYHEWCWICGSSYYDGHYEWWNPIGCGGSQFSENPNFLAILIKNFLGLILLPLVFSLGPPLGLLTTSMFGICLDEDEECEFDICRCICFLICIPFSLSMGIVISALLLVVFLVPAYFFLIYRLLKLTCCGCRKL